MKMVQTEFTCQAFKLTVEVDGRVVGRATLVVMPNELHDRPAGFLEDVEVDDAFKGQGIGTKLVQEIIGLARGKCYKLVDTSRFSRPKVHAWYERLGFKRHGYEFRLDFD
ncbi:GNAT family N-acetyltransferase [Candidatus Falkowbacteria bacterium CG10_big_fil_rev_8_21_14_0_10_39_11]|uniref:GNAT family N-acetyltransferase n=1 Tax=Candidatus Falkowbacteria bacterium CG10_big_fil_rev_8_21_14_0_10_39_11 TaxID=1974565 RepID=A0A2H0V678_9BACT|nr:MAG: GNAT family N-acetyltransferase [Candidatus Falkowbacteria bacterium CG10_big_fil_rev_8_21_14_0_10_39_11]